MVLLYDIDGVETINRNVPYMKRTEYIEGFLDMRHYCRSGKLYQLIGKERRLLRVFGTLQVK